MNKHPLIRKIYLYIFTLVGLTLISIGSVRLVGLALKTYIFTKADIYYEYPAVRPLSVPEGKSEEIPQPTKREIEDYQDKQRTSQRQRDAAESLAMLIVGLPLYFYHWSVIKKDKKEENAQ